MKMQKRLRDALAPHQRVAEGLGVVLADISMHGSGHYKLTWQLPDGRQTITTMPYSASDHRSLLNSVSDLRRKLREKLQCPSCNTR